MARRGRPIKGTQLVDDVDASAAAQQRLTVILETLSGVMTIKQACEVLGIGRSRFHVLRRAFLAQATGLLEPRHPGRARRQAAPEQEQLQQLRRELTRLKLDLRAMQVREEIALVMPHLLGRKHAALKKTRRPARRKGTRGGSCASGK